MNVRMGRKINPMFKLLLIEISNFYGVLLIDTLIQVSEKGQYNVLFLYSSILEFFHCTKTFDLDFIASIQLRGEIIFATYCSKQDQTPSYTE